jgi:uncharacterized protein
MKEKRVILAGGSGYIGRSLAQHLEECEVVVLTRSPQLAARNGVRHVQWDGRMIGAWTTELDGADAIVNLTGRSVNCRHTPNNRREIVDSRVQSLALTGRRCIPGRWQAERFNFQFPQLRPALENIFGGSQ